MYGGDHRYLPCARVVLAAAPNDPSAFNNMGNVSMAMGASCTHRLPPDGLPLLRPLALCGPEQRAAAPQAMRAP